MEDGRVKKSAQNMITGFFYQALTLILSFVSRTVFIHTLGNEYLGLNGIFSDVLSLLSMADLGFSTAMAYSFYKPLANNDRSEIASLIHFYKKIYNFIAGAVLVLGLACVPFLKYIVNT
ncbi:MAG: polysaccharide biosynthesis protein, partial [Lachnospiraceae bacterium]|nr:polysaccharide biosynthesis protein [Lachnospiraceae bacterium]